MKNVHEQNRKTKFATTMLIPDSNDWSSFVDDDIMQQQSAIHDEEAGKIPFVGDKEPLSTLANEYQLGSPILLEKIKFLADQYNAIQRTRGEGNCFFRSFMFSYLEYILESQDKAEDDRINIKVEQCRKTIRNLGYAEFTFEDFFSENELLDITLVMLTDGVSGLKQSYFLSSWKAFLCEGNEASISEDEHVSRCRYQSNSDYEALKIFWAIYHGPNDASVEKFCSTWVEPMAEESDHVHITALSDALGVPIRVVYPDRSSCDSSGSVGVNYHDFVPAAGDLSDSTSYRAAKDPYITLLYRPGHYDILYRK